MVKMAQSAKGKDGENAVTIKTAEGPAGVNGKDGEN